MADSRLAPGAVLGRYRLQRLLGTGGMSSVWKARDERLGRPVAVKVLSETLALDASFVKRFGREARIAAGLSHPNLVGVYDYSADGPRPYIVSEYVEGGTLADRLASDDPIDAEALTRQLLGALEHIHAAGVIHRDVKPANVLIDPDGRSRLTDFGVAQPGGGTRMTETGKVFGTLGYMAPEVRQGGEADERSDLYSAGVVISEAIGDHGRADLGALAARLRDEDPQRRPRSAGEALALLDSGQASTAVLTAPTAVVAKPSRAPRRGRRRVFQQALLALVVIGAGLAVAQLLGGGDGGNSASAGAEKKPRPRVVTAPAPDPVTVTTVETVKTTPKTTDPCGALRASGGLPPDQKALEKIQKACEKAAKKGAESQSLPPGLQPGGPQAGD
jgi:serine/threonine protein kinase